MWNGGINCKTMYNESRKLKEETKVDTKSKSITQVVNRPNETAYLINNSDHVIFFKKR